MVDLWFCCATIENMSDTQIKRRKPKEKRKVEYVRARVTSVQKELIQRAADHAGIAVSSWMVDRLLRIAREELAKED